MERGVKNFHFGVGGNVCRRHLAGTDLADCQGFSEIAGGIVGLHRYLFEIENNFCNVLFDAVYCGELVLYAVDFYAYGGNSGKGRKQNSSQSVSKRDAETSFQRLNDNFYISAVGVFFDIHSWFFYFHHIDYLL